MYDTSISKPPEQTRERDDGARDWLLFIHQLPAEPAYLRVKVHRRLKALGAVALKSSVYVLPEGDEAREDFAWLRREIVEGGGEATVAAARMVEGVGDATLEERFLSERNEEYGELEMSARALVGSEATSSDIERLRRRLDAIVERDRFGASGRFGVLEAVRALERLLDGDTDAKEVAVMDRPVGATWVTRAGVKIDRTASTWLIRRFIDPAARFRFVDPSDSTREEGELRFDMFDGEFTHEGGRCTFETLLARFGIEDEALTALAEIVHDIDCKDERYGRAETTGIASLMRGMIAASERDEGRVEAAAHMFDALYARFATEPAPP